MGKVGTEMLQHRGSGKYIYADINFYTKGKYFQVANFPDEITAWYGEYRNKHENVSYMLTGEVRSESYDSCVSLAKKVFNDFYNLKISEKKVISYTLKFNLPNVPNDGNKNRLNFAPSAALGLEYRVMYVITIGDENFISTDTYENSKQPEQGRRSGGPQLRSLDQGYGRGEYGAIVDHTDELEKFFEGAKTGLITMIEKTREFFGEGSSVLLKNLENSKKLLG